MVSRVDGAPDRAELPREALRIGAVPREDEVVDLRERALTDGLAKPRDPRGLRRRALEPRELARRGLDLSLVREPDGAVDLTRVSHRRRHTRVDDGLGLVRRIARLERWVDGLKLRP